MPAPNAGLANERYTLQMSDFCQPSTLLVYNVLLCGKTKINRIQLAIISIFAATGPRASQFDQAVTAVMKPT
jgi:hypothetical protein